jgi:hypothetical protein
MTLSLWTSFVIFMNFNCIKISQTTHLKMFRFYTYAQIQVTVTVVKNIWNLPWIRQ